MPTESEGELAKAQVKLEAMKDLDEFKYVFHYHRQFFFSRILPRYAPLLNNIIPFIGLSETATTKGLTPSQRLYYTCSFVAAMFRHLASTRKIILALDAVQWMDYGM